MEIEKVGVVGCGLMGSGIAQVSAQAGFPVVVVEQNEEVLRKGLSRIDRFLSKGVERGKMTEEQKSSVLSRIEGGTSLSELKGCDLVVEAIIENEDDKVELYRKLDNILAPDAVIGSNTSSLSITGMAARTANPERFVGLHFFNPVPIMKLVEVVRAECTDPKVFDAAYNWTQKLSKTPVKAVDKTGFIVNRLLIPYLLDAIRAYEGGFGSIADIDTAMMLGCGYPMGPLTLLDFVGLDTTLYIANIMKESFKEERFGPPALLARMVKEGYTGKKGGKGFYDYTGEKPAPNDFLLEWAK